MVRKLRAERRDSVGMVEGIDGLKDAIPTARTALLLLLKGAHRNLRGTAGARVRPMQGPEPGGQLK